MKILASLTFFTASLAAQTPVINGTFFLEENGASAQSGRGFQTVGLLKLDGQGRVSGSEFVKEIAAVGSRVVTGQYAFDADGTGTMSLQYSTVDADGEARLENANYRLIYASSGRISLLRTDTGVLAEGALTPEAGTTTALKGTFVVEEESVDSSRQSLLTQGLWKFDGNGAVEARLMVKSFYQAAAFTLTGRLEAQADGTFDLRLSTAAAANEDGVVSEPVVMTYKLLPGAKTFDLLRTDSGVASQIDVQVK